MSKIVEESFELVAEQHGLKVFNDNRYYYLLPDCNVIFNYDKMHGEIQVHGVIPMDLAIEMYETFKNVENPPFSNSVSNNLENPLEIATHQSMRHDRIMFKVQQTGKDIHTVITETREQALADDYGNCYIDYSTIYNLEAFNWYIETVQNYYKRKRNQKEKTL